MNEYMAGVASLVCCIGALYCGVKAHGRHSSGGSWKLLTWLAVVLVITAFVIERMAGIGTDGGACWGRARDEC